MKPFPVAYDPERHVIVLDGAGGASVMLAFLLKAKFGQAFDPETLFHPELARLAKEMQARSHVKEAPTEGPFTREALFRIAEEIVAESWRSGWWRKSREDQIAYLQDVVAAPHRLSERQVEDVFEEIASALDRRRQVVAAADAANEPEFR